MVIGAPGQLKRLGTDAFTASGPESNFRWRELPGMLSSESWLAESRTWWVCSEGVRSRQKWCDESRATKASGLTGWAFHGARAVGVVRGRSSRNRIWDSGKSPDEKSRTWESDRGRYQVHSLNASVRGSGSNCLFYASGCRWVMSNSIWGEFKGK